MPRLVLEPGQSGDTGVLAEDHVFDVKKGIVLLSTDGGVTNIIRAENDPVTFGTGLTVTYKNDRQKQAILDYMPI